MKNYMYKKIWLIEHKAKIAAQIQYDSIAVLKTINEKA
jgi:hypothetical protein